MPGCPGLYEYCTQELGPEITDPKALAKLLEIPQDKTTRDILEREKNRKPDEKVDESEVLEMLAELPEMD